MQDNRFKYRIKERRLFYLFIKYPKSHIYYMKIPEAADDTLVYNQMIEIQKMFL